MMLIDLANVLHQEDDDQELKTWNQAKPVLGSQIVENWSNINITKLTARQKKFARKFPSYGQATNFGWCLEQIRIFLVTLVFLIDAYEVYEGKGGLPKMARLSQKNHQSDHD